MPRIAAILAWLIAVAAFCWIAAHWAWRFLEPVPVRPAVTENADFAAAILAPPALGYVRAESGAIAMPTAIAAAQGPEGRVRLMGLGRERDPNGSRALFKIDNRRVLWIGIGEALEPGLTLSAIEPDGVRLTGAGGEYRIALRDARPARQQAPAVAGSAQAPNASATAADTCKLTPEQRTRAYILRPEIIDGVMRERNGWTDLFKPAGMGLLVQNPGGTGAMLGLYGNDILTKADGAQLGGLDDVVRLILQPLSRNETVVVSGIRAGQPREWIYAGMNCLAR